jgi:hypothetical protein
MTRQLSPLSTTQLLKTMKTFSCEVSLTAAQSEQFNRTMKGRRLGHVQLDELLSTALAQKYTRNELVLLSLARPPAPLSAFFEVRQVRALADGSLITNYAFDAPQRTRLVAKVLDVHDTVNVSDGDLISDARTFSPLDARTGPMVRAIRRRHGTPKSLASDPVGVSSRDRIRTVIRSVPDEGKREVEAVQGQLTRSTVKAK